jgi:hypothetical protein
VIQQCRTAQIIDLECERIRRRLGAALAEGAGKEGGHKLARPALLWSPIAHSASANQRKGRPPDA